VLVAQQVRSIEPRALQVLKVLVDAKGQVVSQQQMIQLVWGNIVVAPNALQRCIAQLRKVLDDDAKRQQVIKTYPKLGYSLIASVSTQTQHQAQTMANEHAEDTVTAEQKTRFSRLLLVIFLVIVASLLGGYFYLKPAPSFTYSNSTPLTASDAAEQASTLSVDGSRLAFIRVHDSGKEQLIVRDMRDGTESILVDDGQFIGQITFSADGLSVIYAQLRLEQDSKCSQLLRVTINNRATSSLKDCTPQRFHSPVRADDNDLLLLRQPRDQGAQIVRFSSEKKSERIIIGLPDSIHSYSYWPQTKMLAIIAGDTGQWSLQIGVIKQDSFRLTRRWLLPFVDDKVLSANALLVQWQDPQTVLLAHQDKTHWFKQDDSQGHYSVLSSEDMYKALPYADRRLIVEMGRSDWDVSRFDWRNNQGQEHIISRSIFAEKLGQFRPKHQQYSVLSRRSGIAQVWLEKNGMSRQLTHSKTSLVSYLWSPDGQQLAYVADGQLFIFDLQSDELSVFAPPSHLTTLLQWVTLEGGAQKLLLNGIMGTKHTSLSFDLEEASFITKQDVNNQWRQQVAVAQYISSDKQGQLHKVTNGQSVAIQSLAGVKLHWRFYLREGDIYFQDKQFNIWQFNPATEQAKIVGHYNKHALQITDFNPRQQQMLSQRLIKDSRELMLIH